MRGGGADLVVQTRFINKNITKEPKSGPALPRGRSVPTLTPPTAPPGAGKGPKKWAIRPTRKAVDQQAVTDDTADGANAP